MAFIHRTNNISWFCRDNNNNNNNNNNYNNIKESYTERRPNMSLFVRECLQDVHLIKKKINLIITKEKIITEENYVKS